MDTGQNRKGQVLNPEALVEEYEALLSYPNTKTPEALIYDSWMIAELREEMHRAGLDDMKEVKALDKLLLKQLLNLGGADLQKSENQNWWWHLDEIAKKQYPPEKLPEHLKEIYLKHL